MPKITAAQLAALSELPCETVTVPVIGAVLVQGMSGVQRDAFEASCMEGRGKKREFNMRNVRAKLVAACARDPKDKELLFPDAEALGGIRADVLDPLYTVAAKLSGISKEDEDALGKPLETETPSGSSSSASPAN
jgi:hypothetical protein